MPGTTCTDIYTQSEMHLRTATCHDPIGNIVDETAADSESVELIPSDNGKVDVPPATEAVVAQCDSKDEMAPMATGTYIIYIIILSTCPQHPL